MTRGWPPVLLLTVQATLTLRLVWSNTAFADEALYLSAGRLELARLFTGSPVPDFARYFSGAPVIYPPLGAIAASARWLAAARLLSMALMLTATALLHGVTGRLFNRRSAFFAAALFAGLGGTQFLGALATYDALALCLLALGTWLAVIAAARAGPEAGPLRRRRGSRWRSPTRPNGSDAFPGRGQASTGPAAARAAHAYDRGPGLPGRAGRVSAVRCHERGAKPQRVSRAALAARLLPAARALAQAANTVLAEPPDGGRSVEFDLAISPPCLLGMCTGSAAGNPGRTSPCSSPDCQHSCHRGPRAQTYSVGIAGYPASPGPV